jgi:hypothetical protein
MTDFYSITPGDYYALDTFDSGTTWNGNGAIDSTSFQLSKKYEVYDNGGVSFGIKEVN